MTRLTLRKWPDPILKKPAARVVNFDETKLNQNIADMFLLMKNKDGVGLAGPQAGLNKQIIVYRFKEHEGYMINPEILAFSEETQYMQEGCLSFPGVLVKVERSKIVEVEYYDTEGTKHMRKFIDFASQCIQHEIEHLQGKTFIQHLSPLKRDVVTRKMKKWKKRDDRLSQLLSAEGL